MDNDTGIGCIGKGIADLTHTSIPFTSLQMTYQRMSAGSNETEMTFKHCVSCQGLNSIHGIVVPT